MAAKKSSASKTKKTETATDALTLDGTPLVLNVEMENLALSSAAKSEVPMSDCCMEHKELLKMPKQCPKCGPTKEVVKKGKAVKVGGDTYVFLTEEEAEKRKAKSEDTIRVLEVVDSTAVGLLQANALTTPFFHQTYVLTPQDDPKQHLAYATLAHMLGTTRVGVVQVVKRSLKYGFLRFVPGTEPGTGALVLQFVHKPKHTKPLPVVALAPIAADKVAAIGARGAALAKRALNTARLNEDPWAEEMIQIIEGKLDGTAPAQAETAPEPAQEDLDPLSLLGGEVAA